VRLDHVSDVDFALLPEGRLEAANGRAVKGQSEQLRWRAHHAYHRYRAAVPVGQVNGAGEGLGTAVVAIDMHKDFSETFHARLLPRQRSVGHLRPRYFLSIF
jgi:hypothetical protein